MKLISIIIIHLCVIMSAQSSDILDRLIALDNNGKTWYNIDGYSVTSEKFKYKFNEKGIKKVLRKHKLNKKVDKVENSNINTENFVVIKDQQLSENITQHNTYYLLNNNDRILVIWFAKTGHTDKKMEEELVNLIYSKGIPQERFASAKTDEINFGNRTLELESSCYWTFLNTVQCPYSGEMNWSVHKTMESAKEAIDNQFELLKKRKGGEVVSDEIIDIEFEGIPTKGRKVIFQVNGLVGAVAGSEALTIYYVAEKVRGNYMSCVLSHWNTDQINPESQLPPLLEKVMKINE